MWVSAPSPSWACSTSRKMNVSEHIPSGWCYFQCVRSVLLNRQYACRQGRGPAQSESTCLCLNHWELVLIEQHIWKGEKYGWHIGLSCLIYLWSEKSADLGEQWPSELNTCVADTLWARVAPGSRRIWWGEHRSVGWPSCAEEVKCNWGCWRARLANSALGSTGIDDLFPPKSVLSSYFFSLGFATPETGGSCSEIKMLSVSNVWWDSSSLKRFWFRKLVAIGFVA